MNAFDLTRALLTFYELHREEAISAEDRQSIYREMINCLPPEQMCRGKATLVIVRAHIERQLRDVSPKAPAQAARQEPKQGKARR